MGRATPKAATPTATTEQLKALVEEVNTVLNLEPAIKIGRKDSDEDIIAKIKAECEGNVYEIDFTADENDDTIPFFSEEADATFELLGIEIQPGSPPAEGEAAAPATPAPAEKGKGKAAPAPAAAKTKAAPAPAKKKDEGPKFTRYMAFADIVLPGKVLALDDIDAKSDALYVKNGGSSNVTQAGRINDRCMQVCIALGTGEKDAKGFKYTGK